MVLVVMFLKEFTVCQGMLFAFGLLIVISGLYRMSKAKGENWHDAKIQTGFGFCIMLIPIMIRLTIWLFS